MKLYKYLNRDGSCRYAPGHHWPLPQNGGPGDWMPELSGPLTAHRNAYHAFLGKDVLRWGGDTLWEVEARGDMVELPNQVMLRQARLMRSVTDKAAVYRG